MCQSIVINLCSSFTVCRCDMALTTLASVKAYAGIAATDTSRDIQLRYLIDAVNSLVTQQLNRNIEMSEYVEYYSGNGSALLMLNQFPVANVTYVCIDDVGYFGSNVGGFDQSQNLVLGVDFAIMSGAKGVGSNGILRRIGATWHCRPSRATGVIENLPGIPHGNIKVRYTAGFDVIPPAIVMAANSLIIKLAAQSPMGGAVQSISYEDASVTFMNPTDVSIVLGSIEATLANYRSIAI